MRKRSSKLRPDESLDKRDVYEVFIIQANGERILWRGKADGVIAADIEFERRNPQRYKRLERIYQIKVRKFGEVEKTEEGEGTEK